jgi:hypothetical protein
MAVDYQTLPRQRNQAAVLRCQRRESSEAGFKASQRNRKANHRLVASCEEGRPDAIIGVKNTISIAAIGRNPIVIARRIGGNRKEDRVIPPGAPVGQAIAPGAEAVLERQGIKAKPAAGIANEIDKAPPLPLRLGAPRKSTSAAMAERAEIGAGRLGAGVLVRGGCFCGRRGKAGASSEAVPTHSRTDAVRRQHIAAISKCL